MNALLRSWLPLVLGSTAGVASSCSTVVPPPVPAECEVDGDCTQEGYRCFGRVCVPGDQFPPLAHLGFGITERDATGSTHRVEVAGCDVELFSLSSEDRGTLVIPRGRFTQQLELSAQEHRASGVAEPFAGTFVLRQSPRFWLGRSTLEIRRALEGDPAADPIIIDWARYHPEDDVEFDPNFVLWRLIPNTSSPAEPPPPSPLLYRPVKLRDFSGSCSEDDDCCSSPPCLEGLCDPLLGACRIPTTPQHQRTADFRRSCERAIDVEAVRVGSDLADSGELPMAGGQLDILHHDTPAPTRNTLPFERPHRCRDDDDCPSPEQVCDRERRQCALRLRGRAASSEPATLSETGRFSSMVYLYPELDDCTNEGINRPVYRVFAGAIRPDDPTRVLAGMTFEVPVVFRPALSLPPQAGDVVVGPDEEPGKLCVLDLGPPHQLEISLRGEPIELLERHDGTATRCCDLGCLPTSPEMSSVTGVSPDENCTGQVAGGAVQVRAESVIAQTPKLESLWGPGTGCVAPLVADGVLGTLTRQATCDDEGRCTLLQLAIPPDEPGRSYRVRLQAPSGSLFQSQLLDVTLGPQKVDEAATAELDVELAPRHRVHGFVTIPAEQCRSDDCGSRNATILAERLRMDRETIDNTPGPYFHEIATFYDPIEERYGAFILPLDPGVWVLTALPAPGSPGGPARYVVVDLRQQSDVRIDFELEVGTLVTLELEGFARNTDVVPVDRGSWRQGPDALEHPDRQNAEDPSDRLVDLEAPDECLATDPSRGCRIRRLSRGLPLSQVGTVRFSARTGVGGAVCTPRESE